MGKNIPHNTIRDYSKDDRAPYHLEHLNGFNPIPPKYNFLLRKNMFVSLSLYKISKIETTKIIAYHFKVIEITLFQCSKMFYT